MKEQKKILFLCIIFIISIFIITNILQSEFPRSKTTFSNTGEKIIYLTFDDGPSSVVSNDILDILKQQNIKATFFVVGSRIKGREAVLKRMYSEGHSIGLHTYSHDFKKIYASQDVFIDEMLRTKEEISKVIRIKPNIIRFPYGSKPYLNNAFIRKLHNYNFKIYDWNAALSDGVKPNNSPEILTREAIATGNGASYVVLLMHCNNTNINTFKALPQIIQEYKKLGYEFKAITKDTPEFYWTPLS